MSYLILCDSCTDFTEDMENDPHFVRIPLTLHIDDDDIIDDDTFHQKDFLDKVAACSGCPKSSCPSPEKFMDYFERADDIYIVTLSAQLSGSYNSAELAKKMYLEDHEAKNIHIFNSKSASAGQTLIALEIHHRAQSRMDFSTLVDEVEDYISHMGTKFVLETLEILRKNGRLSNMTARLVNVLNLKMVMTATPDGQIEKLTQARGMHKAIEKLADAIWESAVEPSLHTLCIAQCNNEERALSVKEAILKRGNFKDIIIVKTGGVSSLYAADGGIVVCY